MGTDPRMAELFGDWKIPIPSPMMRPTTTTTSGVVVSAMSGETNRLISLAQEMSVNPNPREMDVLVSTGEQVTIALLCMALEKIGCKARSYTGAQVHIRRVFARCGRST